MERPVSLALVGTGIALYAAVALPVARGRAPRHGLADRGGAGAAQRRRRGARGRPVGLPAVAGDRRRGARRRRPLGPARHPGLGHGARRAHDGALLGRAGAARHGDSVAWCVLYWTALNGLAAIALVASVRFVAVVAELDRTRDALAREAAHAERRRLSSDVHDMLGHSLTAISLKADLARRLLAADRAGAARELDDLLVLADAAEQRARGGRRAPPAPSASRRRRPRPSGCCAPPGSRSTPSWRRGRSPPRRARRWAGRSARRPRTSCGTRRGPQRVDHRGGRRARTRAGRGRQRRRAGHARPAASSARGRTISSAPWEAANSARRAERRVPVVAHGHARERIDDRVPVRAGGVRRRPGHG